MIKTYAFSFEEVPSDNKWAESAKFGSLISHQQNLYVDWRELDFKLNPNEVYQLSMDQSTGTTGIFIKNYRNTEAYMIEVKRSKDQEADDFIFDLEMFLHKLCEGSRFSHLIYERPIDVGSFRSSQVLFQLEGNIRNLGKRYDEFRAARLDNIENAAWRSKVILKGLPSYFDKKQQSKESIIQIFDWSYLYGNSIGSDQDVFEAMGVMFGWFMCSFDHLGRPYVRGDRFNGKVGGFVLPNMNAEKLAEQLNAYNIETMWAMENPRSSLFDNLVSAVEKYKVVCVEFSKPYSKLCLAVECNLNIQSAENVTAVLVAANYVNRALFEITGETYHFVL